MSDRLSKKKIYIVSVIVVLVVILGVVIGNIVKQSSKGNDEAGSKQEKPYDGDGLEVEDEMDESVESIDGSGSWEEESKDSENNIKQDPLIDDSKEPSADGIESDDNKTDDNETNNSKSPELEDGILEDKKIWGEIS